MAHYRLYLLNELGRICDVTDLECEDDVQAVAAAERVPYCRPKELWLSDRMVAVIPPASPEGDPGGPPASAP